MSIPSPRTSKLQQIAFTIRDWLGPFYTLGGVVAFLIFLLSLLDPSGRLLQGVQIVLTVASALALAAAFLLRDRLGPLAQRFFAAHGHWIVCLICAFFAGGLVISNWIHREREEPFVSPAPISAPPAMPAPSVMTEPAPVSVAPATPAPTPAVANVPAVQTPVPAPPARKAEAPPTAARPSPPPTVNAAPQPVAQAARPSKDPAQQARCARLVQRLGLGESLNADELDQLRRSCGN